jgi:hypothetical protein
MKNGDYGYIENGPKEFRIFLELKGVLTAFTEEGLRCTFGPITDTRYVKVGNYFEDLADEKAEAAR